jgi:hypothetical protein
MNPKEQFLNAIKNNDIDQMFTLWKNYKINPSFENNKSIILAFNNNYLKIVDSLWNHQNIKDTLHKDHFKLYTLQYNKDFYFNKFLEAIKNNDLINVSLLLKNKYVNPENFYNEAFNTAIKSVRFNLQQQKYKAFEIIKLLLSDSRVNPSENCNLNIKLIQHDAELVNLLWTNKKIKNTLKDDYPELYKTLIKQDIKNKIKEF